MTLGAQLAGETIAVVLAGGKGTRLGALTRSVSKPALPFGAAYKNIDFSLANCVNSGIRRIGVAIQHKPDSLVRHLETVWNRQARRRGEFIDGWTAQARAPRVGYCGTADAVYRNLDLIEGRSSLVLVLAGDHVYRMDYRPMLEFHRLRHADVTVGCIDVPAADASQFGILSVDAAGRITRFVEKPKRLDGPASGGSVLASMGIYVFDANYLQQVLARDAFSNESGHDFGGDILPGALRDSEIYAYQFTEHEPGARRYWRDVGTPAAYWRAHLELLDDVPSLRLDDDRWPLPAAAGKPLLTDRFGRPATERRRDRSLIAADCDVSGILHRSVLFGGVRVASGSVVERAVVLPGAVIGQNCRISDTIVDSECRIPDGMVLGPARQAETDAIPPGPALITAEDVAPETTYACA
jgi:glucose-1-phosphate adenylyltransferase